MLTRSQRVVAGRALASAPCLLSPAAARRPAQLRTLQGGVITPAKMGAVYEVNKADVICGGIATANATVYIINAVLVPMHRHMAG